MNETIALLLKEGGAIAALVVVLLIVKTLVPLFHKKDGNGLTEKRIKDLEREVESLKTNDHKVVKPALRWHDYQIEELGGERSKTLNS